MSEINLELLLGKQVFDLDNRPIGRLQEIKAEAKEQEYVVVEYHLGAYGLLERLSATMIGRAVLGLFGVSKQISDRVVSWDKLDVTDPDHLKLRCTIEQLEAEQSSPRQDPG
jgi:hypothetical protein